MRKAFSLVILFFFITTVFGVTINSIELVPDLNITNFNHYNIQADISEVDEENDVNLIVRGLNGETYSNECYAKIVGVTIAYKGECELIVPPLVEETDYTTLWLTGLLVLLLILVVAGLILVKNKNKLKFG